MNVLVLFFFTTNVCFNKTHEREGAGAVKYDHSRPQKPLCTCLAPGRGKGRPIRRGCPGVQASREGRPCARALGGRGPTLAAVHILHLDGEAEHLGQRRDEDAAARLARGLHLLLAEFPDGLHTLDEVLQELAVPLQVAQGEQPQEDH